MFLDEVEDGGQERNRMARLRKDERGSSHCILLL